MTYSIAAHDGEAGTLGVAVQSHYFSVGSMVPWVEGGVGAVATQAMADTRYGWRGLSILRQGADPRSALAALVAEDEGSAHRQVGMVDASGRVAAHTGDRCIPHADHASGDGFTVQANMMLRDTVCPAMVHAFTTTPGDLAERLLATLNAAEAEGGDIRGRQSAALVIVTPPSQDGTIGPKRMQLQVDDSPEPLQELARLLRTHRAYAAADQSEQLSISGDLEGASRAMDEAARLAPGNDEILFFKGLLLVISGNPDGQSVLRELVGRNQMWAELARRLMVTGLFPNDLALFGSILGPDMEDPPG